MNDEESATAGWFAGLDAGDTEAAQAAIRDGEAAETADWPAVAVETGFADSEAEYYDLLHEATTAATRAVVREREQADDQQLIHAIRALEDCGRVANELTERVGEWAGSQDADADVDSEYIAALAERDPDNPVEERLVSLAGRIVDLEAETQSLRTVVESTAISVAPNLTALAGAELAARLIALAGGLDELAKKPAGTIQVLGAEDALFAHLRGGAPSPKHGVIYTHEYVRGIRPEDRGSAARALAGKLAIAARIDNYTGEYRPDLEDELDARIERIRAREHE
ncbi:MAG: nucleolar protein 56 [Natronomonas sp.]|jgi:nucleolar protein 56